eukprot:3374570-Pyramimonas_sp.AAC.1
MGMRFSLHGVRREDRVDPSRPARRTRRRSASTSFGSGSSQAGRSQLPEDAPVPPGGPGLPIGGRGADH